ncbi:MAG: ribonuclease Z [Ignavibacteriaceae bacterium]|nr:ribonuclease Z [Ignavibacteriaceae bacterium]
MEYSGSVFVLGTSSAFAEKDRFFSSYLIISGNQSILFDCGDGISTAFAKYDINSASIDGILISHLHSDHYCGLPSLLTRMKIENRSQLLKIFCYEEDISYLKGFLSNSYIFLDRLGFDVHFEGFYNGHIISVQPGFTILPFENTHLDKYKDYNTGGEYSLNSSSFVFELKSKFICLSGDIGSINDLQFSSQFKDCTVISEISHVKIDEILDFVTKNKLENCYLSHYENRVREAVSASGILDNFSNVRFLSEGEEIILR